MEQILRVGSKVFSYSARIEMFEDGMMSRERESFLWCIMFGECLVSPSKHWITIIFVLKELNDDHVLFLSAITAMLGMLLLLFLVLVVSS